MKLEEWHAIRDSVLAEGSPTRLDCLNPFKALERWRNQECTEIASAADLKEQFKLSFNLEGRDSPVLTKGVRSFLRSLMSSQIGRSAQWRIPADVYPAYVEIGKGVGVVMSPISTSPTLTLKECAERSSPSILLLPVPHSPTGRAYGEDEIAFLESWLVQGNYLVLDLVYAYAPLIPNIYRELLMTSANVFAACSISKTWLQRCVAGFALLPSDFEDDLVARCEQPNELECGLAIQCMQEQPTLPQFQSECFKKRWEELKPILQSIDPSWSPPPSGYLSSIGVGWERLCKEFDILGVPPALFGSVQSSTTVISCMYDLSERYEP